MLLVGVLKGAFMFMSDLARAIDLPVEFDFMAVSSYGSATRTSGVVRIIMDLDIDLSERDVVIVEDIVDSGLTLAYLRKNLAARGPAIARGLRPAGQGGAPEGRPRARSTSGSGSRPSSSWATASTSASGTGTCPTSWSTRGPTPPDSPAAPRARPHQGRGYAGAPRTWRMRVPKARRTIILYVVIALVGGVLIWQLLLSRGPGRETFDLNEFSTHLEDGDVAEATLLHRYHKIRAS